MKNLFDISDAELEVLEKLWRQEGGIKQSQLLALFEADGKMWKRQTLNTFLIRLEAKGLVKRNNKLVETVYGREEYTNGQMKKAIDCLYGGRLSNFVIAFTKNTIDEKDAKELLRILKDI